MQVSLLFIEFFIAGFGQIWIQILPGTGEFSVFQEWVQEREKSYGTEVKTVDEVTPSNMILTGKIKEWENPENPSTYADLFNSDKMGKVRNGGQDKDLSDAMKFTNGFQTKRISDWHLSDQGKSKIFLLVILSDILSLTLIL